MEFAIIEKDKTVIKIEVAEADQTLLQPLMIELLKDKAVEHAQYFQRHPILDKTILQVEVKSGKPETAIKRVAKKLVEDFRQCHELLEKEIG